MNWIDEGYLISKNKYSENSLIAEVYTKKRGKILSLIIFTPLLIRINLRILLYKIIKKNKISLDKYKYRLNGLVKSMMGKSSDLRP